MLDEDELQAEYEEVIFPIVRARRMRGAIGGVTPFDPSVYGIDALDNLYGAYSTACVLTSYTGSLIRARRSTDNVEQDFGYLSGTGFLSTSALTSFADGGSLFLAKLYDQSGNARHLTVASASVQPGIDLSGAFPVLSWDGTSDAIIDSSVLVGFTNNQAAVSVIAIRKSTTVSRAVLTGIRNTGGNQRIQLIGGAGPVAQIAGRRQDADALATSAGIATDLTNWFVEIGRWDPVAGQMYHRLGADAQTTAMAASGTNFDATNHARMDIGSFGAGTWMAGLSSAIIFVRDKLTDGEVDSLITSLDPLTL